MATWHVLCHQVKTGLVTCNLSLSKQTISILQRHSLSYHLNYFNEYTLNYLGGIAGKMKGRIGDVPFVGCGGYANDKGAAATTGHGEKLIKLTLARQVVFDMEAGKNAQVG